MRAALSVRDKTFFAVVVGGDSVAFYSPSVPSLDEHRQLLSALHPTNDNMRPVANASIDAWTSRLAASELTMHGERVAGRDLMSTFSTVVVIEADCSACRVAEHIRRLRVRHLDSAANAAIVASRTHAVALAAARLSTPILIAGERGLAPELGLVSRDVGAADPIVLRVVGGRVTGVERLTATLMRSQ